MFRRILLLLSHSIFLTSSCPPGWRASASVNGKCYLFVTQNRTWLDAENYCNDAVTDGHLTSVISAFENTDILALSERQCVQYWIGLDDNRQFRNFTWTDGQRFAYTNWDGGQPGYDDNNRCISFNGRSNGKWIIELCDLTNCFVCETFQTSTTTTPSTPMTDCYDWYHIGGARGDGIYQIKVPGLTDPLHVWCDMTTDGGGWTVFQRRTDLDLSFYDKTWHDYKYGFNDGLEKNQWLGNEYIHLLSMKDSNVELRIDIWGDRAPNSSYANGYWWQKQSLFFLDNEANYYTLHASKTLEGNASISGHSIYGINYNIGRPFSTNDNIHDDCNGCCIHGSGSLKQNLGGWWLGYCSYSSLNGKYIPSLWQWANFVWNTGSYSDAINPARSRMMLRKATQ